MFSRIEKGFTVLDLLIIISIIGILISVFIPMYRECKCEHSYGGACSKDTHYNSASMITNTKELGKVVCPNGWINVSGSPSSIVYTCNDGSKVSINHSN